MENFLDIEIKLKKNFRTHKISFWLLEKLLAIQIDPCQMSLGTENFFHLLEKLIFWNNLRFARKLNPLCAFERWWKIFSFVFLRKWKIQFGGTYWISEMIFLLIRETGEIEFSPVDGKLLNLNVRDGFDISWKGSSIRFL